MEVASREKVSPSFLGPRCSTLHLHSCLRSEKREEGEAEKSPHAIPSVWYASLACTACHSISGRKRGQIKSGCQDTRFAARRDALYSLCECSDWKDKKNLISHSAMLLWWLQSFDLLPPSLACSLSFEYQCTLLCLGSALQAKLQ